MSDIADILDRAADLIEPEGAWTQRQYARSKTGRPAKVTGRAACRFCGVGAILHEYNISGPFGEGFERRKVMSALSVNSLSDFYDWNDHPDRTQAEVVAKLREAAARARGQS